MRFDFFLVFEDAEAADVGSLSRGVDRQPFLLVLGVTVMSFPLRDTLGERVSLTVCASVAAARGICVGLGPLLPRLVFLPD